MRYSILVTICQMGKTLLEAAQYLHTAPQNALRDELIQNGRQMLRQIQGTLAQHRSGLCSDAPLSRLSEIEILWESGGPELETLLTQFLQELPQQVQYQVRAVFFAELGEKWDAMQSVYEAMRNDPRFDVVVVRTPVGRTVMHNGNQKQEIIYKDFLNPMGIPSLGGDEYDIATDCPELAFISQPYESATIELFWPKSIAKYTRLVYLPYFLPYREIDSSVSALTQLPVYRFAWKTVCLNQKHYDFYCRHAENKGANAIMTGFPKTDPLVALGKKTISLPDGWESLRDKTVILWNTWYDLSSSSLQYFDSLLEWFDAHRDFALLWRPHPMSDTVTKLYYPNQYPTWQEMLQRANAAENILVDKQTSFLPAFSISHAMISDTSSMLPQYLLVDKPALWIKSDAFRFKETEFIDCRWMEEANRVEDIFVFLERIQNGENPGAELRDMVRRRDLPLADGHCGERVCEAVWDALHEESFPHP